MYVCVCNAINDRVIKECVRREHIYTLEDLQERMTICNRCRLCEPTILQILDDEKNNE